MRLRTESPICKVLSAQASDNGLLEEVSLIVNQSLNYVSKEGDVSELDYDDSNNTQSTQMANGIALAISDDIDIARFEISEVELVAGKAPVVTVKVK